MREQEIRQLIKMVEESDIESLEIRRFFRTIRITKRSSANHNGSSTGSASQLVEIPVAPAPPPSPTPAPAAPAPTAPAKETASPESSNLVEIKAPMVGTFYRAPAPNAPPFVDVNQTVKAGDVLCIIEAMKLMNEIEAEQSGRIVKILVENGQPIEYGQPLFLLDPS
ncbi:MAG: acetyl-CoA carboxylase biotin carboxyl carrier protein [Candidatus Zixiibacteriota bacterium]